MKSKKSLLAFILAVVTCFAVLVIPARAVTPRWTNANSITTAPFPNSDYYMVNVTGVDGTTKIEITATLKEKNILGIYVEKDTTSGTYNSKSARMTGDYDMNPNKDYKVTAVVYVTANGYREKIEV